MRLKRTLRLALLTGLASTALVVGAGVPAQASVTLDHAGGQLSIYESNVLKLKVGYDVTSLKYPSGSSMAYKVRSVRINVVTGSRDVAVCREHYTNNNTLPQSLNGDTGFYAIPGGWATPCSGGAFWTAGPTDTFWGNNVTHYVFWSNDDGTNQHCTATAGDPAPWGPGSYPSTWGCTGVAMAGPGGSGDSAPQVDFGLQNSDHASHDEWVEYEGLQVFLGQGSGQNVAAHF